VQLLSIKQRKKRNVSALAFAPDGRALVASSNQAAPVLWELPAGAPIVLDEPIYSPYAFTFSPGAHVVGWIVNQVRFERDRRAPSATPVKLTPEGETVVMQVTCGSEGRLICRTVERNVGHRFRAVTPDGKGGWVAAWTVGPAGDIGGGRLVAGAARADRFFTWEIVPLNQAFSRRLVVRSALTGEVIDGIAAGVTYAMELAAAPDGSMVVFFRDSSLYAWRPGGKVEKVRTGTLKHYRALAFHPDSRHLLAGNNDTTARLIDTQTWQITRQFAWDIGTLSAVAVSPDGTLAAAGGTNGRVVVWDLDL
jgi:hypothetical protein